MHYSSFIARNLLRMTLVAALSLTAIVWLTQALRLLDYIVNQGISMGLFLKLTFLLMPSLLMMVLPVALFIAVMFLYHKLNTESELVALKAAGLSPWQLSKPALKTALLVTAAGYIVSLWLLPLTYSKFKDMQSFFRNNYASVLLQEGVFASPVPGLTVFVRERDASGNMRSVLVHDLRDVKNPVTMMADRAELIQGKDGPKFLLHDGNRQEMQKGRLSFLSFERYLLDLSFYSGGGVERNRDPQERNFADLLMSEGKDSKETRAFRAEAWHRLLWPAYALSVVLVTLAGMLGGQFNRRGSLKRNSLIVVIVVGTLLVAVGLRNLMTQNAIFVPLAYLNLMLPAVIAGWRLYGGEMRPSIRRKMKVV